MPTMCYNSTVPWHSLQKGGKTLRLALHLLTHSVLIAAFSSVQSLSRVRLFATPWIAARQASLSITNSRSSLRLTSIESVMPSSHLILCHPLFLLPPIPTSIRVFSCWGPAWGSPPMAKVTRKEAWYTQRWDRASGIPLEILEHLPP